LQANKRFRRDIGKPARRERSRNEAMKPSMVCKAERVEKDRAPEPRMHIFWWELDETYDKVEARISAQIASGEASPNDRFIVYSWRRSDE
jgi:hypothetical protein